jgi:uncharacterized membrane protein YraQ (UPF0718 family)
VLGPQLGFARAIGAVVFSVVIGLFMHVIFRKEELEKADAQVALPEPDIVRPLWQNGVYFALMVAILVFANWGRPSGSTGAWAAIYSAKWVMTSVLALGLGAVLVLWFRLAVARVALAAVPAIILAFLFPEYPIVAFGAAIVGLGAITSTGVGEEREWFQSSWGFAKQILPLLLIGVVVAGLLLGRPGHEGLIPSAWVARSVGGNSLGANLFASVAGAFMYFATLTEVPILEGLIGSGMGKGPALALLLAGPALSLPNMLVIRSIMGTKKTLVFVGLVIVMATLSGMIFGAIAG